MSYYKSNRLFRASLIVFLSFTLFIHSSCSRYNYTSSLRYEFDTTIKNPDYSSLNYWAQPFKVDPSDDIPADLKDATTDSLADVFFIHPTTYTDAKTHDGWNADIKDIDLNKKTDKSTILYQASVFNKYCRVYVPRYRQANLQAFFTNDSSAAKQAFDLAYNDIKTAFKYYLENWNQGQPIIIASHSQGTLHAERLLKEFFDGKQLQSQLVCAYIIGLQVVKDLFLSLKPCEDSIATGCIISWRTFLEGYISPIVLREKEQAIVVNPLTWTTDTTVASSKLNSGGILKNFNKVIPNLVHANFWQRVMG